MPAMLRSTLVLMALLNCQVLDSYTLPTGQKYEVFLPQIRHSMSKGDAQSKYPDVIQYEIQLEGKPLIIHLEKTENLIADNYTETHYLLDDTPIMTSYEGHKQDHCHYQGYVKTDNESLARISICTGISGIILTQGRRFLIEPLNLTGSGEHVVYEAEEETPKTCGVMSTAWAEGNPQEMPPYRTTSKDYNDTMKLQKFIELYMVADKSMFEKYNRSHDTIKNRIIEIVNYVNMVYKTINTFVALTGFEIWDTKDQIEVNTSPGGNLERFCKWRMENVLPRIAHDNAQLITNVDFNGPTIGLSFIGTMCNTAYSAGVIQDHSKPSVAVSSTVAHEMGHNLGMHDDSSNCSCFTESCIMTPVLSSKLPSKFSACSLNDFSMFLMGKESQCMMNKPNKEKILPPAVCGNKFTELGEDCDCGTVQVCNKGMCVAIKSVYGSPSSSAKCPEHAICDHEGQCHCNEGWLPPNCDIPSK